MLRRIFSNRFSRNHGLFACALAVGIFLSGNLLIARACAASVRITVDTNGVHRSAMVVESVRLKKSPRPVYIILHGSNGDGARIRRNIAFDEWLGANGTVLVFPDAVNGTWDLTTPGADIAFIQALITRLVSNRTADSRRIYVVGASTGGMLAMRLACEHTDWFAGAAAVISNMPAAYDSSCTPIRPIPFLLVNGMNDPKIPYAGGQPTKIDYNAPLLSTEATISHFSKAANCSGTFEETQFQPKGKANLGTRAFLRRYQNCTVPIELIRVEGGGHSIPGHWSGTTGGASISSHNVDVDTAHWIVDFFRKVGR